VTQHSPDITTVRNFWNARPCNIRHSQKPVGSAEYCKEVQERKFFVESHIPSFADFPRWKGKSVLEIGCGIGAAAFAFVEAGAEYTGVELSESTLDVCKQCFGSLGISGTFYVADAENLSSVVPVKPYDLIYSFGVIHHSPNQPKIIEEAKKFMGPDSELRIMLYSKYSWKSFMILLGFDQPEAQYGCPIATTYSANDVRKLLTGFEVISIEKDHIFPYNVEEYKKYNYVKRFPWNILPAPVMRWVEKKLGWHMLIRARLAR
jgi:SAM-dependent methyltransferase